MSARNTVMSEAQARSAALARRLLAFGMTLSGCMLLLGVVVLCDTRQDAWSQAERSSRNLVRTLQREIARTIQVYDLSVLGARDAVNLPGIEALSPDIRNTTIFDRAASAEFLGSLLVLDRTGVITYDSTAMTPHRLDLGDRDYFTVQRDNPDAGLFLSRPFRSRLRDGDESIAISRRLSGKDGSFEGVVVGTLRLAFFNQMFSRLDLGRNGIVLLVRDDGRLVARSPQRSVVGQDFSGSPVTGRIMSSDSGKFVGRSEVDHVERLFQYEKIEGVPLRVAVGVSVKDVLWAWWRKALVLGGVLTLLSAANMVLCLMFRREMLRRLRAEASWMAAASKLQMMAMTDPMTGLFNRRAFQEALDSNWKRASRTGEELALLMIDVDCFKLFNDHYGHQEGDRALQMVAETIRTNLRRPADTGARYGGEEFIVLLPGTTLPGAVVMAERIRQAVEEAGIAHVGSPHDRVTISIGVSATRPRPGTRDRTLIRVADGLLYSAKHSGRNRVASGMADLQDNAPPVPRPETMAAV